jgi:sporulation protein YlmC with PRC-barrel domain
LAAGNSDPGDPAIFISRLLTQLPAAHRTELVQRGTVSEYQLLDHCNPEWEDNTSRFSTAVAFAAILAATVPAAFAQTSPTRSRPPPSVASDLSIQSDQVRSSKMAGSTVYDRQNRNIGSVKDIILDRDGKVAEVIVDVGAVLGIGGKLVAVHWSDFKTDNNRLTLDRTKEQLKEMAGYRPEKRNTGAGTSTSPATGGQLGR